MNRSKAFPVGIVAALAVAIGAASPALAQPTAKKPNILVIWGDDIGSFEHQRLQPRHDGLPDAEHRPHRQQGALFTDWYGQQSCTAGRAAFITGQSPVRTGLTKVGLPGAPEGMQKEDPTIAELLSARGYVTGQFGKNHLGDRDEMLPTEPRLRRVLRQPLPPQRRGGAGEPRLPEGRASSRRSSDRAASSTASPTARDRRTPAR